MEGLALQRLDGVIFCGDALSAGQPGGDELLLKLLLKHLGPHGIEASRIVAVPGNHDVPIGALPGSNGRYADFIKVWRDAGCKTPWLDGIDAGKLDLSKHVLIGSDNEWMVLAINSCNWSHTDAVPKGLAKVWDSIPGALAKGDADLEKELRKELDKLARYDMARVSPAQMEAMRTMLRSAPTAKSGRQLRMMALHHHLRVPSHREEVKPFADMVNLEQVRTFIAQQSIQVLLHGHKHEERLHFDFIEEPKKPTLHRVLMVAGATFDSTSYQDAMRVVELSGLPWAPALQTKAHAVPRGGMETSSTDSPLKRLPSIDRWLDQSPEKFFVLATALLNGGASSDLERKALDEWVATFKELAVAAVDIAPDGGPVVAIEGPLRLARYLKSGTGPNARVCGSLAKTLEEVARVGSEPPPATEVERRMQWGKRLEELLLEAVGVCSKLGEEQKSS